QGGSDDALPQGGRHTASDKNILGFGHVERLFSALFIQGAKLQRRKEKETIIPGLCWEDFKKQKGPASKGFIAALNEYKDPVKRGHLCQLSLRTAAQVPFD